MDIISYRIICHIILYQMSYHVATYHIYLWISWRFGKFGFTTESTIQDGSTPFKISQYLCFFASTYLMFLRPFAHSMTHPLPRCSMHVLFAYIHGAYGLVLIHPQCELPWIAGVSLSSELVIPRLVCLRDVMTCLGTTSRFSASDSYVPQLDSYANMRFLCATSLS